MVIILLITLHVVILYFCCVFFFFKQKTAYEMRISDWSSDVCSSDLYRHPGGSPAARTIRPCYRRPGRERPTRQARPRYKQSNTSTCYQIGRASCRERVCQYV